MKKNKSNRIQKGQGLIEYIALTALVAIVSIAAVRAFGSKVQKRLNQVSTSFEHNMQIGLKYKNSRLPSEDPDDDNSNDQAENKPTFGGFRVPKSVF